MKVIYNGEMYKDIIEVRENYKHDKIQLLQAMCPCGNEIDLDAPVELKIEVEHDTI